MFQRIREYLSRSVRLSEKEIKIFENSLELRLIPKKTILLQAGEVCNFEAYINKGCIREYFIDDAGIELTLQFATEDWWVSDITSFEDQIPSDMYIETLEDCELLVLTRQSKENLINEVPQLERMFRLMIQRHLSKLQKRLFKTVSSTAMDQYIEFVTRYPTISQRVSQQYIASYLGITPEFLSRLRAKHLKNG
ncbi:cAMP-binding domain of CRP or a regulatory subunit of cAMP-dependent protein kinases [Flavobacterium sp. CF108]|uniref:Crp/Fnr family transcriptional regulator n=1 Tax=unclassified Flavobacterium TaxID=196869 RepID=UPI0008D3C994|nr:MULTISPECIES: Crp/Fnr family transcriptional regulator [unclassified Flavobacterium]SEO42897.1 cAMP-binding domain of CRP or a regulatory subunit of cAMP-dependent protein kinases [Flavobacterium sp. fv08]SHH68383.1 cAMP-binding domain of CRP or a regulatory subunit of cAMP-dependent protein kinases [Flavobacterium sp. CF108]